MSAEAATRPEPALQVEDVRAGYGGHEVVRGVSLSVERGHVACIVGPNGAGKSTLLKAITGDAQFMGGHVWLDGLEVTRTPTNQLVRRGLAWVPQVDDVFNTLSVKENLELGGYLLNRRQVAARVEEVLELFPLVGRLLTRVAGRLSGGERKLLAIARALMTSPSALLLDEPTAGLSPEMTNLVLQDQIPRLRDSGVAILLVEQRAIEAIAISSTVHVMVSGAVRAARNAEDLRDWDELAGLFLGEA